MGAWTGRKRLALGPLLIREDSGTQVRSSKVSGPELLVTWHGGGEFRSRCGAGGAVARHVPSGRHEEHFQMKGDGSW